MAKIIAPTNITGPHVSLMFQDGVAETDNPWLIQWFREHGYEVVEPRRRTRERTDEG